MKVGELVAGTKKLLRENINDDFVLEALSDSYISLWETLLLLNLGELIGGPATATFSNASDHVDVATIPDPLAAPTLTQVAGVTGPVNIEATYTFITDSGTETLESPVVALNVTSADGAFVFNLPAGMQVPQFATGWNVYARKTATDATRVRQNQAALSFQSRTLPLTVTTVETPDEEAEFPPSKNTTADDIWYIKTLSVQTPAGERHWSETEVGSALWTKFASSQQGSASLFQPYVFAFDGSRIDVRPLTGMGFDARYFYVRRPHAFRTLATNIALNHPAAPVFMKYSAISLICLSTHEYQASSAWDAKAEKERLLIMQSGLQQNTQKSRSVIPLFR